MPCALQIRPKDGISPDEQLARGKIDVVLQGKKLRGGFTLVRTGRLPAGRRQGENWLFIKHRDEHADPSWDIESPELDRSVLTGRSLKEIEEGRPAKKRRNGAQNRIPPGSPQ
jgi:bifunctional non-homologous end joining protein LigD